MQYCLSKSGQIVYFVRNDFITDTAALDRKNRILRLKDSAQLLTSKIQQTSAQFLKGKMVHIIYNFLFFMKEGNLMPHL